MNESTAMSKFELSSLMLVRVILKLSSLSGREKLRPSPASPRPPDPYVTGQVEVPKPVPVRMIS